LLNSAGKKTAFYGRRGTKALFLNIFYKKGFANLGEAGGKKHLKSAIKIYILPKVRSGKAL
jgi:hypothetical protein